MVAGRIQFLVGWWTEGFHPCRLAVGHCPQFLAMYESPYRSLHMVPFFIRASTQVEPERETASKTEVIAFYKLPLTVTSYPLCRVLFIRGKSRGPAHTHRERIAWTREYRESGITGGRLRQLLTNSPLYSFESPILCSFSVPTLLLLPSPHSPPPFFSFSPSDPTYIIMLDTVGTLSLSVSGLT